MVLRLALLLACACLANIASACNIPVFRYALERWKSDAYELIVYHDQPLSNAQLGWLKELAPSKLFSPNLKIIPCDLSKPADASQKSDLHSRWASLRNQEGSEPDLPYVLLRTKLPSGAVNAWHGTFDQARQIGLTQSPARTEIASRLLKGDSIVWLIVKSADQAKNSAVAKLLEQSNASLDKQIKLPEGIGLPGSELFSDTPLLLQFSTLAIGRQDVKEQWLVGLLSQIRQEAFSNNEPLVIPIFGRGRALEVIPARDLSPELIRDLTIFLSGPCSCQVKERNPGFDILMSTNWDRELFGADGQRPPDTPAGNRGKPPKYLAIPPGRKR